MRIAITGSSGFIGSALVRSLEADGHEAVRVVRSGGGTGTVRWDIDRGEIDAAGLEGLDGVVHLAGEGVADKRWADEQKRKILESRTKGTALLAGALASLSAKPPVLLSGSGMDYYGDRGDEQLTEASSKGTGFLSDVVQAWESATATAGGAGIRVAHLRTCMVLDGDGGALPRMVRPARFGILGKMGSGKQWMSWISLADEIGAIRYLLETDISGPVNLGAPGPVTNAVFTKSLGRVLRRPTFVPVPSFGPKLLLGSELAQALLFDSKRVLPDVLVDSGYEFKHPDLETALHEVLGR
jgi:uncharacterized protein (TIGR01777 family)